MGAVAKRVKQMKKSKFNSIHKNGEGDLADHFLTCSKLGRYLTVEDNSRFMITDDFRVHSFFPAAAAVAAIYSKDVLVAQAALLPLSDGVESMNSFDREKYERLFSLIEEEALGVEVKMSARAMIGAKFKKSEIKALEADLGDKLSPARIRYRSFLSVIKDLMEKKLTAGPFLDEFREFTQDVAGRLDFGIYSFCLDRMFGSVRIPLKVKKLMILEILSYPPIIRRELLTNILVFPGQTAELRDFSRYLIRTELDNTAAVEIDLLEAIKLKELSIHAIERGLRG